jgi:hypothetical protein
MKKKDKKYEEKGGSGGLAIVLAILLILLFVIGFLIFRIMNLKNAPSSFLQNLKPVPAATVAPVVTPVPLATPAPEATPEPTPEPTPDPAQYIKIATSKQIKITKQPGGEKVYDGNNAVFVAHASGASTREWRFVAPDYSREIVWNAKEIKKEFPGLRCEDGDTDIFIIYDIPREMNGWYAVCLFTDGSGGMLASDGALLTVMDAGGWTYTPAAPSETPKPTPEVVEVTIPGSSPQPTTEPTTEPTTQPTTEPTTELGTTSPEP